MATIGNIRKLVNHILRGDVSAGDLDTSLAAVVEQVGGVAWSDGQPQILPTGLDLENLGDLSFGNGAKAEPHSYSTISVYGEMTLVVTGDGTNIRVQAAPPPPVPVTVDGFVDGVTLHNILAPASGEVSIYLNGVRVVTQTIVSSLESVARTDRPSPSQPPSAEARLDNVNEYLATLEPQPGKVVPLGLAVHPGDVLALDVSGLAWQLPQPYGIAPASAYQPAFVPLRADFFLRVAHVPRGTAGRLGTPPPTLNPLPFYSPQLEVSGTTVTGQGPVLIRVKAGDFSPTDTETVVMTDGVSPNWSATLNLFVERRGQVIGATAQIKGNLESQLSNTRTIAIGEQTPVPPDAPVITYPLNGAVVSPVGTAIQGTAAPGLTITVYGNGGSSLVTGQANEVGVFLLWAEPPLGNNALYAVATDASGLVSLPSNTVNISVLETRKTATPTLVSPDPHVNTETVSVSGTAEPFSSVLITAGWFEPPVNGHNVPVATVTADAAGNYMSTFTVFEGLLALTAYATTAGCIESTGSPTVWVDVDRTAPTAPIVTFLNTESDGVTRKILVDATTTVMVAFGDEGIVSTELTLNGSPLTTQEVNATTVSYTGFIDVGTYTLVATITDAAGNTSSTSKPLTVEIAVPPAPTIFTIGGGFTSPHAPSGTGTIYAWGVANAPIRFRLNGTTCLETTIGSDGNLTAAIDLTGLADGAYVLDAIQSPVTFYVESPVSNTFSFVIDGTVSSAPTINAIPDSITEAALTQGWVGGMGLDVSGTGVPGSYLDFYLDGSKITWINDGTVNRVKTDGTWSFHFPNTWLDAHLYSIGVAQRTGGRPASSQATESFTVNWTLPPSAIPAWGTVPTQAGSSVAVPGTATAGATVRVYAHDGGAGNTSLPYGVYSAVADGAGAFSVIVDMSSIATGQSAWLWMTAQAAGSAESPWTSTVKTVQKL